MRWRPLRCWRARAVRRACAGRCCRCPRSTARVIDQTGTLDAAQREALEAKLAAFEQKKGSQIVVLMVPTTQPEDIASYANRVATHWKIGRKDVGDGMLVIVAKNDRKMRIEVAKALEGAVPDLAAARIIDDAMKPRFRAERLRRRARRGGRPAHRARQRRGAAGSRRAQRRHQRGGHARQRGFNWQRPRDLPVLRRAGRPGASRARILGSKLGLAGDGRAAPASSRWC